MIPPRSTEPDETAPHLAMSTWARGSTEPGRRYRVIRDHARGGLGIVFLARDEELHRDVALKEIRADKADQAEFRARFLLEAEVTGRLEHPGIVPVYGLGRNDDGRPYYIMRFIRGETLKEAIAALHAPGKGRLPDFNPLVGRLAAACYAVAYAHSRKIIHRDLKPSNIMLGEYGETLVVDWGLAKAAEIPDLATPSDEGTLHPESESDVSPTLAGFEMGTRGYMSPEQAAGRLAEIGPSSDVYSLGATLYCLLTGHRPFADLQGPDHLRAVEAGAFPRPRALLAAIPRPLEAICLKAMALRPVDRYASARAMAEDLERWMADRPTLAYPEPRAVRLARWSRRHKTPLVAAAILLACATAGLAAYAAMARRETARVSAAWRSAAGGRSLALEAIGRMLEAVAGPDLAYLPNTESIRLSQAEAVVGFYRDFLAGNPNDQKARLVLAYALRVAANLDRMTSRFDEAERQYAEAIDLLTGPAAAADPLDPDETRLNLALTLIDAGENLRMSGKPRAAEEQYLKALEILKRTAVGPLDRLDGTRAEALARIDLAQARIETGRPAEAKADADRATALLIASADAPRAAPTERMLMASAQAIGAIALRDSGEAGPASDRMADAVRRARELVAARRDTDTLHTLATILSERGRLLTEAGAPAFPTFDEAVRIAGDLSNQHARIKYLRAEAGVAFNGRGLSLVPLGRLDQARRDCDQARAIFESLATAFPRIYDYQTQLGRASANLARISLARGKPAEARDLLARAIAHHQAALALNPESLDDLKLQAIRRAELDEVDPARPSTPKAADVTGPPPARP